MSTKIQQIEAVREALGRSWNAGDATAYAALFAPTATYVSYQGHIMRGREAIRETHQFLFSGPLKDTRLETPADSDESITFLTDQIAVVVSTGGVRLPGQVDLADRDSVQTMVLVHQGDGWEIAAFHNTRKEVGR